MTTIQALLWDTAHGSAGFQMQVFGPPGVLVGHRRMRDPHPSPRPFPESAEDRAGLAASSHQYRASRDPLPQDLQPGTVQRLRPPARSVVSTERAAPLAPHRR